MLPLISFKVRANLKTEISSYYLNYLWWVIEPVLLMLIFYLVFGIMMNRGGPNFVPFLLTGLVTWTWFQRSISNGSASILNARHLISQVRISKIFFPLVVFSQDLVKNVFALALLFVFLLIYGIPMTATWAFFPVIFLIQFTLICGVGIICAALVPFLPDLKFLIATGLQLLFFASGVFYNIEEVVLPKHRFYAYLNPMAGLIKAYREILLENTWPDWNYLAGVFLFSVSLLALAFFVVRKLDQIYPRVCQQ